MNLPRLLMKPVCSALAASALAMPVTAAHALGRLADVQIVDRDSGETLTLHRHRGEHWVAGRPGARYAISLRNRTGGRLLGVISVDGVNAISGATAAVHQTGYVLDPWSGYAVTGWRKSDHEVAAFHFTASEASYADRTGRPQQVGVIGVAVFRERPSVPPAVFPQSSPAPLSEAPSRNRLPDTASAVPPPPAPEGAGAQESSAAAEVSRLEQRATPASPAPRLGTGHGAREQDSIGHTTFVRLSQRPDEIIRIRYDSHANLVAMGIIPGRPLPPRPNPFPAHGYAPDPQ